MRRLLLLLLLVFLSVAVGYSLAKNNFSLKRNSGILPTVQEKRPISRFAIVSDSHSDNGNLEKALARARGFGINFVVGLGDWTTVGTLDELSAAKKVFDGARIPYYLTSGDHDLWDSRNRGEEPLFNYQQVFGSPNHLIERNNIQIVILDTSDIYSGISPQTWKFLSESLEKEAKLKLVMAHKTPFHPDSKHIMGEDSAQVASQAKEFLTLLREKQIDGFFAGDLHFFARYLDPSNTVKISGAFLRITTVGAVTVERNFQGPRFAIVTVYNDYSWEVEDVEIR